MARTSPDANITVSEPAKQEEEEEEEEEGEEAGLDEVGPGPKAGDRVFGGFSFENDTLIGRVNDFCFPGVKVHPRVTIDTLRAN